MKINVVNTDVQPIQNNFKTISNEGNMSLLKYLKFMYWMGYLPFEWIDPDSQEFDNVKFRVCGYKTLLMLFVDFLKGSLVIIYYPTWHWLNIGKDFDMKLLLDVEYYKAVFGSTTNAFCNLQFLSIPLFCFWAYAAMGKY